MSEIVHYHELQNAKDCSIHSLNNALGRRAITPQEAISEIARRVAAFREEAQKLGGNILNVTNYEKSLSDGKTYFTAEAVWVAALSLGRISAIPRVLEGAVKGMEPVPSLFDRVLVAKAQLIMLGKTKDDTYHAVAVRNGNIHDSLRPKPLEFSQLTLASIYAEIFGVYVL